MYKVQEIRTRDDFARTRLNWNGLVGEGARHRLFMDHEWFDIWMDHFLEDKHLKIIAVSENGALKAVLPLTVKREKFKGKFKGIFKGIHINKIELLGNIASPIRTILIANEPETRQREFLAEAFKYLLRSSDWSVMQLDSLPEEDFPFDLLESSLKELRVSYRKQSHFGNWYLDNIEGNGEQYVATRPSYIRKNLRSFQNKCKAAGDWRFEMVQSGSEAEIDAAMDDYYQVLENSWKEWEVHPTFHRALAHQMARRGHLRLGLIYLNERPIASQLWLVCGKVAYIVRVAYDQDFKKLSPGSMMGCEMMKHVIDTDQVEEVDYLIGDEPYKKDWTPNRRERKKIVLFNRRNPSARFLAFAHLRLAPFMDRNRSLQYLKRGASKMIRLK